LFIIQKSRLATFVEMGNPSWDNLSEANRTSGSIRREKSTDSSSGGSSSSEELVRDTTVEVVSTDVDNMEVEALLDFSNEQHPLIRYIPCFPSGHSIGNADDNISLETIESDVYKSIVNDLVGIQGGEQTLSTSNPVAGFKTNATQRSSVLGTYVTCLSTKYRLSSLSDVASRSSAPATIRNRFGPVDCDGIHISSCGHAVHQECHDRYLFSLKQR
jgi:E3 ubiquitin-protein ligase UBR3